jgi:hypothetical protein
MKKAAVLFGLLLCSLALGAEAGQSSAPAVPLDDFLASLGSSDTVPAPTYKNHCSASWNCPIGTRITCTGHTLCTAAPNYVECDGARKDCPICSAICPCGERTCFGSSYCDDGLRWIECDGRRYSCTPVSQCP